MEPVECRAVMRFLYLRGRTPRETCNEMKATYGENAPSYDVVKHWHRQFKCGRTSVETAPIPGRPHCVIDENAIRQMEATILIDRRITLRQLTQDFKMSVGSVEKIIRDHLHIQKFCGRWIPRLLTPFQKQDRVTCSQSLLAMCQGDQEDFFDRLITQDETWWPYYSDSETEAQSNDSSKKARVQSFAGKVMLTVFWDQHGVLMMDFAAEGTTITGTYYALLLQKLLEVIRAERHHMLTKGVCLLQDNTPAHNSHVAQTVARSCGYEILPHPPYSPDLAPSDFHLFPAIKSFLSGKHFQDGETLISEIKVWLLTQPADFYRRGLHRCIKRWENCVTLGGTYVEKDE